MTKFENIGVQYQQQALTKEDANRAFNYSCQCCCNRGISLDCDRCAIHHAHASTIAIIDDLAKLKEKGGYQCSNGKKRNCADTDKHR